MKVIFPKIIASMLCNNENPSEVLECTFHACKYIPVRPQHFALQSWQLNPLFQASYLQANLSSERGNSLNQ